MSATPDSELARAAATIARHHAQIKMRDRVLIIADKQHRAWADALYTAIAHLTPHVRLEILENFGTRPFAAVPEHLHVAIDVARPTISFTLLDRLMDETTFRIRLLDYLVARHSRHFHMIGLDAEQVPPGLMVDGEVLRFIGRRLVARLSTTTTITITSPEGTHLVCTVLPQTTWQIESGQHDTAQSWVNLPSGGCQGGPLAIDGVFVVHNIVDYLGQRLLASGAPARFHITNSRLTRIEHPDATMVAAIDAFLAKDADARMCSGMRLGTNLEIGAPTGNPVLDGLRPCIALYFGRASHAPATNNSSVQLAAVGLDETVTLDHDEVIMQHHHLYLS